MRLVATVVAVLSVTTILGASSQPVHAAAEKSAAKEQPKKVTTVVAPGDSLSLIASRHNSTYQRLFYANKQVQHPDVIHPGQKLRVPAKKEKLKNPSSTRRSYCRTSIGNTNQLPKLPSTSSSSFTS